MDAVSFSPQSTFVHALSQSAHPHLFSSAEKRILGALCFTVFVLPLTLSILVLKNQNVPTALKLDPEQMAYLTPASLSQGSDELAMAEIFINKANESLSDPAKTAQYLTQAQSLITLTTQTGERVEAIKNQLAQALGGEGTGQSALQRIAAPAAALTSLGGETVSNATSKTVVMKAGTQTQFVDYPELASDTQIYITVADNRENAVVYVSSREQGRGFTLATLSALGQDLLVTWYEIKSQ